MERQRPTELNKKIKQLRSSRDNLKDHNRQKSLYNKRLRDRNVEITTSRDHWKMQCSEHELVQKELRDELKASQAELEQERTRANLECERVKKLESEIEKIRGKKSGS